MSHYALHHSASCHTMPSRSRGLTDLFFGLSALWRSRQTLRALDADRLNDLGISTQDAVREARRAPWDVPAHWLN